MKGADVGGCFLDGCHQIVVCRSRRFFKRRLRHAELIRSHRNFVEFPGEFGNRFVAAQPYSSKHTGNRLLDFRGNPRMPCQNGSKALRNWALGCVRNDLQHAQ